MKVRSVLFSGLVAGLLAVATPAHAALITGQFGIAGSITYDNLYDPTQAISATNFPGAAGLDMEILGYPPPPNNPTEPFFQVTVATGYFAGLGMTPGGTGRIKNITNVTPPTNANYTYVPAGVDLTATPITNFLSTFSQALGLQFDLTLFPNQSGAPGCPATPTCVEGPFKLTETVTGVDLAFDVYGNFINGGDSGFYQGNFTVSMAGLTLAEIGTRLFNGTDLACGDTPPNLEQPCAFAATFKPAAAVPEPATMLTFGLGSLVLARMRRRKA